LVAKTLNTACQASFSKLWIKTMRRRSAYSADCSAFLIGIEMPYGDVNADFCPEDTVAP
jgi:hypothetical protein